MNDPENTTQATHTPGPWVVWPASNGVKITDSLGRHVAVIPRAAPEKFAWYDEARSAIAKAKEVK
jgi:hypothetical protein